MADDDSKPVFTGPKFNIPTKKYGLIIPNKANSKFNALQKKPIKPCIFDEDENDDEEDKMPSKSEKKEQAFNSNTSANRLKKQTQIDIEKALSEDPNVFEYDNVYDEMEKEKVKIDPKLKKNESREPKYIAGIMKAAAKRQMEFEKLQERKIHKERQEEGDLWKDKETFVTSAYRKKMEERQKLEEEERNQDQIEALLDVRKQKDLSGFYSNLLKMKSGEMIIEEEGAKDKRLKAEKEELLKKENEQATMKQKTELEKSKRQKKTYRSKKESSDEEEEKEEPETTSMDTSVSHAHPISVKHEPEDVEKMKKDSKEPDAKKLKLDTEKSKDVNKDVKVEESDKENEPEKPKLTREQKLALLFDKRTVGSKFDEELSEYFHRKSSILSLKNYIERDN